MSMPTPHTFAFREIATAANLNTFTDAINYLLNTVFTNVDGITVGATQLTVVTPPGIATATIDSLLTPGTKFAAFGTANSGVPGTTEEEISVISVTGTSFNLNMYRTTGTQTLVYWAHIGYH